MNRYISFLIILFALYACHREAEYESVSNNESECFVDVFADVDMDVYNSLIVRKEFRDIANLYKENKDAIYTCTEEQLPEQYLKADTIRSLVQYYAKRLDCPNLALYIAKYVESDAEVLTKCMTNEKVYSCWNRAWDYYKDKYPNLVYSRIKDVCAVKHDLCVRVGGGLCTSRVLDHVLMKGHRIERFTNQHDMSNYLSSLGIPVRTMSEKEVHAMNRILYEHFYSYYISNRWKQIGGEKTDMESGNVCSKCKYSPCICKMICSECKKTYEKCICCEVCDRFPCICVPAVGEEKYKSTINIFWTYQNIKTYLEDYCRANDYTSYFHMRYTWFGTSTNPICVFKTSVVIDEPYYIPEFIYTKSMKFAHIPSYVIYTNMGQFPVLLDIYSFARMIRSVYNEVKKEGIPSEAMRKCYMGFWLTPYETYVFASGGKLGLLGDFLEYIDINNVEGGFQYFENDIYTTELTSYPNQSFASLSRDELLLYRCMVYFQKIGCDIEIYRWDKNARENGDFVKPWKYEK